MAANGNGNYGGIVLPRWLRWTVYLTSLALFISGALWLVVHYGRGNADDLPPPAQAWLLRVHGLAMLVGLFVYGSLLRTHMINAWQMQRNRSTGVLLAVVLALLTLTGYLLYYGSDESMRSVISIAHWVIGLAIGVVLPFHVWQGRRERRVVR